MKSIVPRQPEVLSSSLSRLLALQGNSIFFAIAPLIAPRGALVHKVSHPWNIHRSHKWFAGKHHFPSNTSVLSSWLAPFVCE